MKRKSAIRGRPALDLIEEAVHLLRQTPMRGLLIYHLGAVPFVLGLLHFWADMSCGAFAERHCASAALGLAALFLWMKTWQVVFASGLRARLNGQADEKWTLRRWLRALLRQGIIQPSKFFVLPAALIVALPFAWTLAFYENATALDGGESGEIRPLLRRAANQAKTWPGQNHLLVGILSLLAFFVWLNAVMAVISMPYLLKMFLGIETAFTRAGRLALFNTTFLAATVALAWLVIDPLLKSVYTLRSFYGEARRDGADLLAELAGVRANGKVAAAAAAFLLALVPLTVRAESEIQTPPPTTSISPDKLGQAVEQTLAQDKYAWRLPREQLPQTADGPIKGWLRGFIEGITETLGKWARAVRDFIRDARDWFEKYFKPAERSSSAGNTGGADWMFLLRGFACVLLALAAAALALLLWRLGRQGWKRRAIVVAEVLPARPDLTDENVTASQLPEDGWLKLARELMDQGELRLALRALYLASLAFLAEREIVSLARFKSNRDYEVEVSRRARGRPDLHAAFSENVAVFDRAWYGLHEVTGDSLKHFQANLERIRA